jgi:molecular chaperone DnaK
VNRTIGIDLGTSTSSVATVAAGEPTIIPNRRGHPTTPSVVSVIEVGGELRFLVGEAAQRAATTDPQQTVHGFKRLIGRRFDHDEVQALAGTLPYRIVSAPNGDAWVQARGLALSPPELSALILRELRTAAETFFGEPVRDAVITVPAHFDNEQRRATRDAAEIAGLEVRRLLNEPTAAALGYGAHRGEDRRVAVCDLGGGTFDVSIVNVEAGIIEVISTTGDLFLGGEDVDRVLVQHLLEEIQQDHRVDVASDPRSLQRLADECRSAKHRLSQATRADLSLVLPVGAGAPLEYKRSLRRDELEDWARPLLDQLEGPCLEATARCGLAPRDLDAVLLVGGATRMPAVQRRLGAVFGRQPKVVNQGEIVSIGAATLSAILDGGMDGVVLLDVTSRALGVHAGGGSYQQVVPRNTAVPTREHKIISTTRSGQREIEIDVYEGESASVSDNRLLGRFVCAGLPDAPAGEVMVLLEFTVDVDGILRVGATQMGSGQRPEFRLRATAGLTRADVRRAREQLPSAS